MVKTNALTTHEGKQFTGSKNSEIFVENNYLSFFANIFLLLALPLAVKNYEHIKTISRFIKRRKR